MVSRNIPNHPPERSLSMTKHGSETESEISSCSSDRDSRPRQRQRRHQRNRKKHFKSTRPSLISSSIWVSIERERTMPSSGRVRTMSKSRFIMLSPIPLLTRQPSVGTGQREKKDNANSSNSNSNSRVTNLMKHSSLKSNKKMPRRSSLVPHPTTTIMPPQIPHPTRPANKVRTMQQLTQTPTRRTTTTPPTTTTAAMATASMRMLPKIELKMTQHRTTTPTTIIWTSTSPRMRLRARVL
mmetsp:Transcript_26805/g.75216  ORF Transcript_26805/g.75216 Transcript_26805/m.75216 type:complete len:240 (+) Transcript_26805:986-1705(+)